MRGATGVKNAAQALTQWAGDKEDGILFQETRCELRDGDDES